MAYRFLLWQNKFLLLTLAAFFYVHSTYARVALRAVLEGPAFGWAYVSGQTPEGEMAMAKGMGLQGHADYALTFAFVFCWLIFMGLRKPDRFFQSGIVVWNSIALGVGLWLTVTIGDQLRVEKQTLGISVSHFWGVVFPVMLAWALSVAYALRNWRRVPDLPVAWNRCNSVLTGITVAGLAVTAILLNAGPQHGTLDRIGIGMLYVSFLSLLGAASQWSPRHR